MNAERFAFWCAEAKQICRQSYFADGLAIEISSFKETFCKIDEPQCPVFHNCMGKKEVIQKASKAEVFDMYGKEDLLPKTLVSQSLQTGSSGSE